MFPFTYADKSHDSCIKREDDFWCATKVHDNGTAIKGFWGQCNLDVGQDECDPTWSERSGGIGITYIIIILRTLIFTIITYPTFLTITCIF